MVIFLLGYAIFIMPTSPSSDPGPVSALRNARRGVIIRGNRWLLEQQSLTQLTARFCLLVAITLAAAS
jgi:hypothetical protein